LAFTVDNGIFTTFANTTNTNTITADSVVSTDEYARIRSGILVDGWANGSGLWTTSDGGSEREKGEGK
jgi:predicted MarR family transcription regulator